MVVMKFGGTSLAGAAEIRRVRRIVRRFRARRPVVVVSAMAGVTDELLEIAGRGAAGLPQEVRRRLGRLEARHRREARAVSVSDGPGERLGRDLLALFAELEEICRGILLLRELTRRSLDLVASFGERLSARIVAAHLAQAGLKSAYVDARDLIVTDDSHGAAIVDFNATARLVRKRLLPLPWNGVRRKFGSPARMPGVYVGPDENKLSALKLGHLHPSPCPKGGVAAPPG